jgi:hypothetical protein
MFMLMLLGVCSVVTAILLMLSTTKGNLVSFGSIVSISSTTGSSKASGDLNAEPVNSELDPDFVLPATQSTTPGAYRKECPQGCEKNGNCNYEEGR